MYICLLHNAHSWQTITEHIEIKTIETFKTKELKTLIALFVQHATYNITVRWIIVMSKKTEA